MLSVSITGLLKSQDDMIDNGYRIIYHKNGKISSEGWIKNGRPDGSWKTYYTTGILKSEGKRKNHLLDSTWVFYNSFGDTIEKINYLYGKRNGYTIRFYSNRIENPESIGNIISKELYLNDKKEGLSYYYYEDGSLKKVSNYVSNSLNGDTYHFNPDGMVVEIISYKNGVVVERNKVNRYDENDLKTGMWKEFYNDLTVKREINYEKGLKNGIYKEYDNYGNLNLILKYNDDLLVDNDDLERDSVSVKNEYDENGILVFSGTYKNDLCVGIHRYFDKEGNVVNSYIYNEKGRKISEGIVNQNGSREGSWKILYENGNLKASGSYLNNNKNGPWKYFYEDGKIEQEGTYRNGQYDGKWVWYYDDSRIRKEEAYYNGKEEGLFIEYDRSGMIISQGEYFEGEKEDEWYYYVNDHKEIGSYVTGLRNGKWKYYYDNDVLSYEGNYVQGNPDGKHKYYYDNGVLKEEQYFSQGIKEKHWKKYDEAGNLIITISYADNREVRINGERIDLSYDNKILIK